ncbi:MAG: trehalose-phosphatase [Acidobacteriia bacterium]|nr:trehalose-phosphatase [Terriglobia bacterium]
MKGSGVKRWALQNIKGLRFSVRAGGVIWSRAHTQFSTDEFCRPEHLFLQWDKLSRRLKRARRITLFMDFDGTLVPLCLHPDEPRLAEARRELLGRLARRRGMQLIVITGRRQEDVENRVGVPGITYLGLYGWEHQARTSTSRASMALLRRVKNHLAQRLSALAHIWIEDKQYGFAVHYRGADSATLRKAWDVFRRTLKLEEKSLRFILGKKVWEVLPLGWPGKGAAVETILSRGGARLPIFLGDDITDESAFGVLQSGLTIRVGRPRRTRARYYLRNPQEVEEFLIRMERVLA